MVTTGPKVGRSPTFDFRYGYVEARIRVPRGRGLWPAFWALNGRPPGRWPPEIDVMEARGDRPGRVHHAHHWAPCPGEERSRSATTKIGSPGGYRTYGLLWRARTLVRGRAPREADDATAVDHEQTDVPLAQPRGRGQLAGAPGPGDRCPATMRVDWVTVWQRT